MGFDPSPQAKSTSIFQGEAKALLSARTPLPLDQRFYLIFFRFLCYVSSALSGQKA